MASRGPWPGAEEPSVLIDAVAKTAFVPLLRAAGFGRSARTWRRRPNQRLTQVLNLQASPWNAIARDYVEKTRAAFTVNLGLHVNGVDELIGWTVKQRPPLQNECHVQLRIGNLLDGSDFWWEMSSETDVPTVAEVVGGMLRDVVLPWFDKYSSLAAVREWFDDPPPQALVLAGVPAALDALRDRDGDH